MTEKSAWKEIADKDKSVWKPIDKERKFPIKKTEPRNYNEDLNVLRERMKKKTKFVGGN